MMPSASISMPRHTRLIFSKRFKFNSFIYCIKQIFSANFALDEMHHDTHLLAGVFFRPFFAFCMK